MSSDPYQRVYNVQGVLLPLKVIRSKRKTMALHVLAGGQPAEARVPLKCAWRDIDDFIESRLEWLLKATNQLKELPAPPQFLSGHMHGFLGVAYTLEVEYCSRPHVKIEGKRILMGSKKPDCHETNQRLFQDFLKVQSQPVFAQRLDECTKVFPCPLSSNGLRIRRMKARWGSCSQAGEICLNSMLMQKAVRAIDLVITHELCHLKHFSHNAAFYDLMDQAMPDWRTRESLLGPLDEELKGAVFEPEMLSPPSMVRTSSEFQQLALL